MKIVVLISLGTLVLSSAAVATTNVSCKMVNSPNAQNMLENFELSVGKNSLIMKKAHLSNSCISDVQTSIRDLNGSTDSRSKSIAKYLTATVAASDGSGLSVTGKNVPYQKPPKTPRVRYQLTFSSNKVNNDALVSIFAPEADSATLFVFIENGKPDYSKVMIEYNGGQGPYNDQYTCD